MNTIKMIGRPPQTRKIRLAKKYRKSGVTFRAIGTLLGVDVKTALRWAQYPEERLEQWKNRRA